MKMFSKLLCGAVGLVASAGLLYAVEPTAPAAVQSSPASPAVMHGKDGKMEHNKGGMKRSEYEPPKSRQEAIGRAKERVKKLESMSDEQWNQQQKERQERREAWEKKKEMRREAMKGKLPEKTSDKK